MIAESSFITVFGSPVAGGDDSLKHIARAAIRQGYAVVPCKPGTKEPMCTLTSTEVRAEDQAARERAQDEGKRRWDKARHACGLYHALTDEARSDRVLTRLIKNHGRVNLGIELRASRVVVVDVDTEVEDTAFQAAWLEATGSPMPFAMTVKSPGVFEDETWKHKNGGHYWFRLPETITLPLVGNGKLKMAGGWVVMWANSQVLVPPSVRKEGAYELVGDEHLIPPWLLRTTLEHMVEVKERTERQARDRAQRAASGDGQAAIDVWSAANPWDEILEDDGWFDTGKLDRCTCPIWTAPGVHGSDKSATAHEVGCTHERYDDSAGHLPLHVWTDNPPDGLSGNDTVSKVQFVAVRHHGGDVRSACRALGITAEGGVVRAALVPLTAAQAVAVAPNMVLASGSPPDPLARPSVPSGTLGTLGVHPSSSAETGEPSPGSGEPPRVWYFADEFGVIPERQALIENVLLVNSYARIIGKSNHGKSFLAVDLAGHIATGKTWNGNAVRQGRVAYIAAEDAPGIVTRIRAWETHHGAMLGRTFLLRVEGVQAKDNDAWAQLVADMKGYEPVVIFIDTQAASTYGIKENDNDEAGFMNAQMTALSVATGATVVLIHHKGHAGEHGRGASAVIGALDTEIAVDKDEAGTEKGLTPVVITCTKQKNWQTFAPVSAMIQAEPNTGSAVLVVPDPLSSTVNREPSDAARGAKTERCRRAVAEHVYSSGNGLGGVSQADIMSTLAVSKSRSVDNRDRFHRNLIERVLKGFIEHGHLLDAETQFVIVDESTGDSTETRVMSRARRLVVSDGLIQELGLGS